MARAAGGVFHLRLDDIDQSRARAHWAEQIYDDLRWLGLSWPIPVWCQSARGARYRAALQHLWDRDLLYPCTCSRRDIQAAANAPQEGAPLHGPDGLIYPGTCRNKPKPAQMPEDTALRLNMRQALQGIDTISFQETGEASKTAIFPPHDMISGIGDPVLSRRDMAASYHLSIVVDDADQHITHVIRGKDLFDATKIHVLLQSLLDLPTPIYHHHKLIRDETGKRLAKRDDARAIALYRTEGFSPKDLRAKVGL